MVLDTPAEVKKCGHKNLHHIGTDGKRTPLYCSLPAGHAGDHSCQYVRLQPTRNTDGQGRYAGTTSEQVQDTAYWRDGADSEPGHVVDNAPQMTMLQKEMLADWLSKNPGKSVQDGIVDLAMKGQWR